MANKNGNKGSKNSTEKEILEGVQNLLYALGGVKQREKEIWAAMPAHFALLRPRLEAMSPAKRDRFELDNLAPYICSIYNSSASIKSTSGLTFHRTDGLEREPCTTSINAWKRLHMSSEELVATKKAEVERVQASRKLALEQAEQIMSAGSIEPVEVIEPALQDDAPQVDTAPVEAAVAVVEEAVPEAPIAPKSKASTKKANSKENDAEKKAKAQAEAAKVKEVLDAQLAQIAADELAEEELAKAVLAEAKAKAPKQIAAQKTAAQKEADEAELKHFQNVLEGQVCEFIDTLASHGSIERLLHIQKHLDAAIKGIG